MDKNFRILNLDIRYDDIKLTNKPWKPTIGYMVFGFLWILFSDKLLSVFVDDLKLYEQIQMYKGWFYVVLTGLVLYYLVKLDNSKLFGLTKQIAKKNEELVTFSEELVAMEEELEKKLNALNELTCEMKRQKDFVDEIYNSSNMVIMVWKKTGELLNYNAYFEDLFNIKMDLRGEIWTKVMLKEGDNIDLEALVYAIEREKLLSNVENDVVTSAGEVLNMIWNMSTITDPNTNEEVIVSYGANLTGERQKEKRLLEIATTDSLTNLKNRVAFENDISGWIQRHDKFTLYLIGLDNFKYLNDLYGHFSGDILLEQLGNLLMRSFNTSEIYRWSGDEFLILDKQHTLNDVDRMLRGIMDTVVRKWNIQDVEYNSSASVGVVRYPQNGLNISNLVSNLDVALNHAKRNGRGQHKFFSEALIDEIRYEALMEKELKRALAENSLTLNFQPIFDMDTENVVSLEVLLRWPSNPLKEYNIGNIISLAEKTGQIIAVDRWVITHTFKLINENADLLCNMHLSINISVQSFHSKNFIEFIKNQIEMYDIVPSQIELEITEYSIVEDFEKSSLIIEEIKGLGLRIALDDFGTKYSSLNYLSKLPFDVLKIDKSYVDHILDDCKDRAIVNHLIKLSEDLDLVTIVEGIEMEDQKQVLIQMGCRYGQGYLYSKPLALDKILPLIEMNLTSQEYIS